MSEEYTGKSVSYYSVDVLAPINKEADPYTAECIDIIEALGMDYAEGNAFKAIWRKCAARTLGKQKRGYTDGLYDAEKVEFYGGRMVALERVKDIDKGLQELEFDESRADIIGQNGNDGEHYAQTYQLVESDGLGQMLLVEHMRLGRLIYLPETGNTQWIVKSRLGDVFQLVEAVAIKHA